jgi:arsenite methyltransferase
VTKLRKIGFADIQRGGELAFGINECAQYPVFTPELLGLMHRLIPPERHGKVARSVIFTAQKPMER